MLRYRLHFAALWSALIALSASAAQAQNYPEPARPLDPSANAAASAVNPHAKAGATLYVSDNNGKLWTVTLGTYALHYIGNEGLTLTDIAFNPKDGKLWGVSFTSFYTVDTSHGRASFVGSTQLNDINALVFNKNGLGYFAGYGSPELYGVDVARGRYFAIGRTGSYKSAGDLSFYNGALVLAGFTGSSSAGKETLVKLDAANGRVLAAAPLDLSGLYGLATVSGNTLYGFAGAKLYLISPSQKNIHARTTLLHDFTRQGLGRVNGAAYKGDV